MKDEEKKVNAAEEVKTEEEGVELTEEELAKVSGGVGYAKTGPHHDIGL